MLATAAIVIVLVAGIGVAVALNHFSDHAQTRMVEAKSLSHGVGWYMVWCVLALSCAAVVLYLMTTSNKISQSYQPTPTPYRTK